MIAFLIGYVEEGATLVLDLENLAVFIAAFVGLLSVTFFYEGIEGIIESRFLKQKVKFKWAPQAILFALVSTLAFIYLQMPIGFIFGFIALVGFFILLKILPETKGKSLEELELTLQN